MERMSERLTAIEAVLKKLEPVESLLERVALLENTIYTTRRVQVPCRSRKTNGLARCPQNFIRGEPNTPTDIRRR